MSRLLRFSIDTHAKLDNAVCLVSFVVWNHILRTVQCEAMVIVQPSKDAKRSMTQLSPDALQNVFACLDSADRAHAAAVCWSWRVAARRSVTSVRLCASTPFDYYSIYPSAREVYVCEPSLKAASGGTPSTVLHLQRLEQLPNLRWGTAPASQRQIIN